MGRIEQLAAGTILTILLFLAPAFVFHTSPRFAGSLTGFVLGVSAATLLLLLLVYPLVKYSAHLRAAVTRLVSLRALLTFHVYAGVLGAFLAILHTGHKYQSALGIGLVISTLVAVATGVIGRYYLPLTTGELRDAQTRLAALRSAYDQRVVDILRLESGGDLAAPVDVPAGRSIRIRQLVGSIADLEYAIGSRETIKRVFTLWIVAHVLAAILMYLLLALHVAGEIYYGLRWLP
jgi:hypothetical protein